MPHYLRFAHALIVTATAATLAACGSTPPGGGSPACACPATADAAAGADVVPSTIVTSGAECTAAQLDAGCQTLIPIGGPLAPPELAAA